MKNIVKSDEPESLKRLKSCKPTNWESIHTGENKETYDDCLLQCMEDQGGLCGYTEVKLNGKYHIDHFIKRSLDARMTFEWENMIAAVHDDRFGADYKDRHISVDDYDPNARRYREVLSPVWDELTHRFVFSTDGRIKPADETDVKARRTIELFNLNEHSLCNRRKQVMNAVRAMRQANLPSECIAQSLAGEDFPTAIAYELRTILENDRVI